MCTTWLADFTKFYEVTLSNQGIDSTQKIHGHFACYFVQHFGSAQSVAYYKVVRVRMYIVQRRRYMMDSEKKRLEKVTTGICLTFSLNTIKESALKLSDFLVLNNDVDIKNNTSLFITSSVFLKFVQPKIQIFNRLLSKTIKKWSLV